MSSMKAYLAEKYMSGPKADAILMHSSSTTKKKKRKAPKTENTATTSMIQDDDAGWGDNGQRDEDEEMKEAVVEKDRGFKKRKVMKGADGDGWTTLQEGENPIKEEEVEREDEKPLVVEEESRPLGGLFKGKVSQRKAVVEEQEETAEDIARQQQTIYRDATGRKIDTRAARAEAARKKREKEEAEAKKMEWGKGLVQRDDAEKRREELEKAKNQPFARRADDKEMNEELKERERWNDPAAAFLTKKTKKGPRKPEYTGPPPPPNRFGIKPGYRWDGVDRGNGFEKKLFQSKNASKRLTAESYQWSVDDM
ncbi:Pre-mRNA-splicing factor cwc26 [Marasmius sp. AFHP31]|nr:Pre-mRNA-splicing factor cwc26 [Marasmius sp. AFHP31]